MKAFPVQCRLTAFPPVRDNAIALRSELHLDIFPPYGGNEKKPTLSPATQQQTTK
jgi:hypothetical protein